MTRLCTWVHLTEREIGASFYLYNVHLDHESQAAREKSAQLLLERIWERPTTDPVIVTGDFNAPPDNPAILRLIATDSPVSQSALAAFPQEAPGTFHGFTGETSGGSIDHIFLSPEWQIVRAQILHGDGQRPFPSDHFPLAATLQRQS